MLCEFFPHFQNDCNNFNCKLKNAIFFIYKVVTVCLLVLAGLAVGGYRRVARNHRVTQTFFFLFYSGAISNQLSNHNFGSTREKK
jgi:hypothetical protein